MDLDGIMLSEMSQQRQMPYMISLYKGNLKKQNKWTYIKKQKQSQRFGEKIGASREEGHWERREIVEGDVEVQTSSCKINESLLWKV